MNRLTQIAMVVLLWSCGALANSIGFTDSSTASGMIGTTSFSDAAFTIRGFGNAARVVHLGGNLYSLDLSYVTITIQGVGTFKITTPTRFFANGALVGFSRAGADGYDLMDGPSLSQAWNMQTSLGPITGSGLVFQWSLSPVLTNAGVLVLNDSDSDLQITFSASANAVTPEPGTVCLLVTGLAGVASRSLLKIVKKK